MLGSTLRTRGIFTERLNVRHAISRVLIDHCVCCLLQRLPVRHRLMLQGCSRNRRPLSMPFATRLLDIARLHRTQGARWQ